MAGDDIGLQSSCYLTMALKFKLLVQKSDVKLYPITTTTVVIRYNTIGGVHKYESCYKPIVLYEMARFYLVLLDTI